MRKTKKTAVIIILFLCLGGLVGYTVGSVVKSSDRSTTILQVLKDNCNCKEVNQIIYAQGIQFGANGLSTEKGEFQLIDCEYISVKDEVTKIQKLLQSNVKDFDKVDLLELEFVNKEKSETVIIKKGKIQ
ncbi:MULTISPECIES: hypothetical protein [Tenacibaculum]|uniref:hypothetical protein n=1 Tax=Tenacibaculum TaxID=104267 RepID=UPI001F0A9AD7|nr:MULTISPECIES: hypothetical protein [Tenacibaculum]MCH3881542.1 hypothetical protein [Tenacibaculum aquimarinum]MCH3883568.1 hypothetical protein [Tenacibaculum aquimarinum]MDO6598863.1 hypothetical protein [Tenacibaculum sp. 1_MG-2023]